MYLPKRNHMLARLRMQLLYLLIFLAGLSSGFAAVPAVPNVRTRPPEPELNFEMRFMDRFVTSLSVTGAVIVHQGSPVEMAALVNSQDISKATWLPFKTNIVVP